jgi:hypothetical protein
MIKHIGAILLTSIIFITSCKKDKAPDTAPATVAERLEINEPSQSILTGNTISFTVKFYNNIGQLATTPTNIVWSTANNAIATINQQGLATGVGVGQTQVKVTYNNTVMGTALLTVAANTGTLATITITPTSPLEIRLNEMSALTATGKTSSGATLSGLTFSWSSNNSNVVSVNNNGQVNGAAYGTANIVAMANGIESAPLMVQVIRKGTFSGTGSGGMAKLKIENGNLKLQTTSDFVYSSGAPDLRIYLGNNSNNVTGAVEVASLRNSSGAQSWNVTGNPSITQYRYAIIWCAQFGGTYGVADLGN